MHRSGSSILFPYTTLFRSDSIGSAGSLVQQDCLDEPYHHNETGDLECRSVSKSIPVLLFLYAQGLKEYYEDRKSTRLNSSHVSISYAVFCLKKKLTFRYII